MKKIHHALLWIAVIGSVSSCTKEEPDLTDTLLPTRVILESDEWLLTYSYTYEFSRMKSESVMQENKNSGETYTNTYLYSYSNGRIAQRTWENIDSEGQVTSTTRYYNYYENGNFHSSEFEGGEPSSFHEHSDDGLVISENSAWDNEKISEWTYSDEHNLLRVIRNYDTENEFSYEYVYDDLHCPYRNVAQSDPENNNFFTCVNNITGRTYYLIDGSVDETSYELEYNEHGFLTKRTSGDWTYTYEYNQE